MKPRLNYALPDRSERGRQLVQVGVIAITVFSLGAIALFAYLSRPTHPTENEVRNWLSQVHPGDNIQSVQNFFAAHGIPCGFQPFGNGPPEPLIGTIYKSDQGIEIIVRFDADGHVTTTDLSVFGQGI